MPDSPVSISRAIDVFVHGFSFGRSLIYPHDASQVEGLWVMRDRERKNPQDYRKEEWVAFDVKPETVDAIVRRHTRGHFFLCIANSFEKDDRQLRHDYKRLGYRLLATEPIFVHSLKRIPRATCPYRICQVKTPELVESFARASQMRAMLPEHLGSDAPFRQYVALDSDTPIGWVRSVRVGDSSWIANMGVQEAYRRQGIGRALLARALRDDRRNGIRNSVLLASHTGALLYPHLGFQQIGTMYLYREIVCRVAPPTR